MAQSTCDKPVMVCLSDAKSPAELHTPEEAIAAMAGQRFGVGGTQDAVWMTALTLLTRAALDPTPQNYRVAQCALEVLTVRAAPGHR